MNLELHPLCTLFPRLSGAEFESLKDDIRANGLRNPIVTHEGMILDGGNRYRACIEIGITPKTVKFDGGNLVSFVLSANLHRRHLSPGQQAAIVASAQDWARAQTVGRPNSSNADKSRNVAGLSTAKERAAQSGASLRTQEMADKVAKESPELAKRVAHGEVSLPAAVKEIERAKPVPQAAIQHRPAARPKVGPKADAIREELKQAQERGVSMLCSYGRLTIKALASQDSFSHEERQVIEDLRTAIDRLSIIS